MQEVSINEKADFDINNQQLIDKMIQAALLAQNMIKGLEGLDVIPGYIIYEEVEETEKNDNPDITQQNNEANNTTHIETAKDITDKNNPEPIAAQE